MSDPNWKQIADARDRAAALPESEWVKQAPKKTKRLENVRNSLCQLLNRRSGQ